jgi:hypothetical protein
MPTFTMKNEPEKRAGQSWPRAGHPGGAIRDYPRTSALDTRVKPVYDEAETAVFIFGRCLTEPKGENPPARCRQVQVQVQGRPPFRHGARRDRF